MSNTISLFMESKKPLLTQKNIKSAQNDFHHLINISLHDFETKKIIKVGSYASNFFFEKYRLQARFRNKYTIYDVMKNSDIKKKVVKIARRIYPNLEINIPRLYGVIRFYYGIASQFRPSTAKYLYLKFGATNILDPCAGWGDRCLGALATSQVKSYIGIDTNLGLKQPYQKMINSLNSYNKKIKMIWKPAESINYNNLHYNFVFTSIMYYNVEKYPHMPEYSNYEVWKNQFLEIMIIKIWKYLPANRFFCINAKNIKGYNIINDIDEVFKKLGAKKHQCLRYYIHGRKSSKDYYNFEPILVYQKLH